MQMSIKSKILAALGAACMMVFLPVEAFPAEPAGDVTVAATCKGKSKKTIVRKYYRGVRVAAVLRCGTKNWGYRHIRARHGWSKNFDNKIRRTVATGVEETPLPGSKIFERVTNQCPPRVTFKVVTNPLAYGGDKRINPQGIITAYAPKGLESGAGKSDAKC
jgi:hypothetical protein